MVRKALVQSWFQAIANPQVRRSSRFGKPSMDPVPAIAVEHEFVVDPEIDSPSNIAPDIALDTPADRPSEVSIEPDVELDIEAGSAPEHAPAIEPAPEPASTSLHDPRTLTWQTLPDLTSIPEDAPEADQDSADRAGAAAIVERNTQPVSKPFHKQRSRHRDRKRPRITAALKTHLTRTGQATARGFTRVGDVAKTQTTAIYGHLGRTIGQYRWTVLSLFLLMLAAGTGGVAMWWLSRIPPAPECDKISAWSADSERLYCAQIAAQTGNPSSIRQGIDLVKGWTPDHPLYQQGQRALEQWSNALLDLARDRLNQGDLDGAVKIAQEIPASSPLHSEVKQTISRWQEERNRGQRLYDQILAALKNQTWNEASALLAKLALVNDPRWQKQLLEVRRQIEDEKAAGLYLKQAQAFAKANPPATWGQAIALTDPINRKTFVWQTARSEIQKWRDAVFSLAAEKILKQEVAAALTLVKSVPSNIEFTPENQNLLRLVYASDVDTSSQLQQPLLQQLGRLMMASQMVQQIDAKSRFADPAKALKPRLELQAEDAFQVTIARSFAYFGQQSFLQTAIEQAQQIAPKRPRRIEAQTLIAQWRKDIERIQDNPILVQAQQIAQAGQVPALRQAIGLLSQIPPGRALRSQAQTQIQSWLQQIQTLEDQPILTQARTQAKSGQLSQAIQTASRIASGRALHAEAQREIANWADQIQAISDRATLDRAAGLAAEGSLTRAIDLAEQIRSRSVWSEARQAIAQWKVERDQILRNRAATNQAESSGSENRYSEGSRDPSLDENSAAPAPIDAGPDPSPP